MDSQSNKKSESAPGLSPIKMSNESNYLQQCIGSVKARVLQFLILILLLEVWGVSGPRLLVWHVATLFLHFTQSFSLYQKRQVWVVKCINTFYICCIMGFYNVSILLEWTLKVRWKKVLSEFVINSGTVYHHILTTLKQSLRFITDAHIIVTEAYILIMYHRGIYPYHVQINNFETISNFEFPFNQFVHFGHKFYNVHANISAYTPFYILYIVKQMKP